MREVMNKKRCYLAFLRAALLLLELPPKSPNVLITLNRFFFSPAGAAGAPLLLPPLPGGGGGPAAAGFP